MQEMDPFFDFYFNATGVVLNGPLRFMAFYHEEMQRFSQRHAREQCFPITIIITFESIFLLIQSLDKSCN